MPLRPGISDETIARLNIRRVTASEAHELTGEAATGIYIPFEGVTCFGGPYGRLRFDKPRGDKKYHQRTGSKVHNYIRPELSFRDADLILVEGEFKAIALTEAGFPAVGTSGFYSWSKKIVPVGGVLEDNDETDILKGQQDPRRRTAPTVLHREIRELIKAQKPKRLIYVGDPDTALNIGFSDAMSKMAELVDIPVFITRIPYDAPHGKGVDDIRESLGQEAFAEWFRNTLAAAYPVKKGTKKEDLICYLIERERSVFPTLKGEKREKAVDQSVKLWLARPKGRSKLAAQVEESIKSLVHSALGIDNSTFLDLVAKTVARQKEEAERKKKEEAERLLRKQQRQKSRGPVLGATVQGGTVHGDEAVEELAKMLNEEADSSPAATVAPAEGSSTSGTIAAPPPLPFPPELFNYEEALKSIVMVGEEFYAYSYNWDGRTYRRSETMSVCSKTFVGQLLKAAGFSKKASSSKSLPLVGEIPNLSQHDAALFYLSATRCKGFTHLLFRPYGPIIQSDGTRLFNRSTARVIEPNLKPGEAPVTRIDDERLKPLMLWLALFFQAEDGLDHFLYLLSHVYKAARAGKPVKTRAIFFLGKVNSGKSLLIDKIIPMIFGQPTAADAYRLLRGEAGTASILESYVCKLSDKDLGNQSEIRRYQQGVLSLLADHTMGGRALYEDVKTVEVVNLFMFSSNRDGSVVKILDGMGPSTLEKFAIYENEIDLDQVTKIENLIRGEETQTKELIDIFVELLPYFCSLLANITIPKELQSERYGVVSFVPERFRRPTKLSPVEELVRDAIIEHGTDMGSDDTAKAIYETLIVKDESLRAEVKASQMVGILAKLSVIIPTLVTLVPRGDQGRRFKLTPSQYRAHQEQLLAEAQEADKER